MQKSLFDIPILSYHKIDTTFEFGINIVRPDQFRRQMAYLAAAGYQPVNFRQLQSGDLPEKPVIITFDDGYESIYRHACPVLKEFGFTAVVYIITDYIGKDNTWDANLGGIKFRHLNLQQISELHRNGIEIGAHTRSHRGLLQMNESAVYQELQASKTVLENLLNTAVLSVAYPFGQNNAQIMQIAEKCGYRYGVVNIWQHKPKASVFNLRRIPVYQIDALFNFKAKLTPGLLNALELFKLHFISWPARLTPYYQKLFAK